MIEIYSTKDCHKCKLAKEWFNENNMPFIEYNLTEDKEKLNEMLEITGQRSVPVIKKDNNIFIGFDEIIKNKIYESKN